MEDLNFKDTSKEKLRSIIFRSDTPAGKLFDIVLLVLIVLSITLVFLKVLLTSG